MNTKSFKIVLASAILVPAAIVANEPLSFKAGEALTCSAATPGRPNRY